MPVKKRICDSDDEKDESDVEEPVPIKSKTKNEFVLTVTINKSTTNNTIIESHVKQPWTELYRPHKMKDIILDNYMRIKLENFISVKELPNLLFCGSPGTGKTSTILCVAKQIVGNSQDAILELNASDNRGVEMITKLINYCDKKIDNSFENVVNSKVVKKIIILDEADAITSKAQNLLVTLMDKYKNNVRFCFTCNNSSKIIEQIQSRCFPLHYKSLNKDAIKVRLLHICQVENVPYEDAGIDAILFIADGDIRSAINNMEAVYNSFRRITYENVYSLCYYPHPDLIIKLLTDCVNKNMEEVIDSYKKLKIKGYCNSDIVYTMINILKHVNIDEDIRINYIKILSDIHINLNEGLDTALQMYSCFARMMLYSQ